MRWIVSALLVAALVTPLLAADDADEAAPSALPAGLQAFLEARLLESNRQYGEAADKYAEALRLEPESTEIRMRYASLLSDMGMATAALELIENVDNLDVYGLRVKALATTQAASRNPELVEEAEVALRAAIEEQVDDPNLMLSLAQVVHRQGRPTEAEAIIRDLRDARGGSTQLTAYHAGLLRETGSLEEAAELFGECTDSFPTAQVCRENLVSLLVELDRPGEAGEAMLGWLGNDELDQLLRAAALLYDGDRPQQALTAVLRVLDTAPDSPRARTLEALILSSLGRESEAAGKFKDLLRKDKENLDLMLPLAWTLARAGRDEEARKVLGQSWELVQEDAGTRRAVSVCLTAARVELVGGRPLVAREWLDRVADPELAGPELVGLLAESYRRPEHWNEGVAAMLRLQPRLAEDKRWEAVAYEAEFRLRNGDRRGLQALRPLLDADEITKVGTAIQVLQVTERWDDVQSEAAAALERLPGSTALLFTRAAALERLGRFDESATVFKELLEVNPDDAATANYLGYMWADQGTNLEQALALISQAVEQEPDNAAYLDSLGWVYYRLGDLEQSAHWLRRAIALGDPDGTVLGHLGEVLLVSGDSEEARELLQQALHLGSEDADHVQKLLDGLDEGE